MKTMSILAVLVLASGPVAGAEPPKPIRIAAVSLAWDQGQRTLAHALAALDEAARAGADLACLPAECVYQPAEPIDGPTFRAIAAAAGRHKMNVVANLRELAGGKVHVTSFLCNRDGKIVGAYRKSHRLPYENDFTPGDTLPVFATDIGPIGMTIGTDRYFPEIDAVLKRRGARLIVRSTSPEPVRDEHLASLPLRGRAVDYRLWYAVARYAGKKDYGGYRASFSWQCRWPLGRAQVIDPDGHTRADSGHRGGVAMATLPAGTLDGRVRGGGLATSGTYALITAEKLPAPMPRTPGMKRTIRAAAIESEHNMDRLIAKLDTCGRAGCDIVCLWEYVWYHGDDQVAKFRARNRRRLARIAEAAKRHRMYVVIAGELERGFNEAILYDRSGKEFGRYTKINQTTSKDSKHYRAGKRVGIFDLDFGRICVKVCADVYSAEIDRVAALHQVDLMLLPTQDCGPFTDHTRQRDSRRCVDDGYFLLRAACPIRASDHRTYIMDPWGMVLAGSQYRTNNEPIIATLRLDNRPKYHEWPPAVRKAGPYPDPYKRGVDAKALANMYSPRPSPVPGGDLRAILLRCRRPALYRPAPKPAR